MLWSACSAGRRCTCRSAVSPVNVVCLWHTLTSSVPSRVPFTLAVPHVYSLLAVAGVHLVILMVLECAWKAATLDRCLLWASARTVVLLSWMRLCHVSSCPLWLMYYCYIIVFYYSVGLIPSLFLKSVLCSVSIVNDNGKENVVNGNIIFALTITITIFKILQKW